ncbi:hypothetical protein [Methylobacterium gregans]|uniref:Uncharacterized protein n=1 Tax=Methylobacterium gregans TaxID=374424 RepID=A0AA37HQF2_9HYPH|nr:hypothetical protein [Methylobacterium gregans]MDQ0524110.1 hypothetical protein [Methylobacterium gregans]GJD80119.1 hypothetical protein NBEOAGPD_3356 [Methylobacterium gregans]GLS56719.1 hypothetical protein GCM10007886_49050 [Methylobacterium gregans]
MFDLDATLDLLDTPALPADDDAPWAARDRDHGRAALAAALDDGLLSEEVDAILDGRRVVEAFPVRWGESPPAYATRAVAEMMAAYLR